MTPHTPVLFLPGLLNDASLFQHQLDLLTGHASPSVGDLTHAESIAELAAQVLAAAPVEPFVLVGLSMGGYVAFEILRQAPQRVCALALFDTSARPDSREAAESRQALMKLAETDLEAVVEELLPRLSHPERVKLPEVRGVIHSMMTSLGKEVFLRQQHAILTRPDSRPDLAAIRCPTLVVCGRDDLLTPPALAEEIAAGIAGSRLEIIDTCGHLATLDQPEESGRILLEWLQELDCGSS